MTLYMISEEEVNKNILRNDIDELIVDLSAKWIVNSSRKEYSENELAYIKNFIDSINYRIDNWGEKK